jgi:hypothetical protein
MQEVPRACQTPYPAAHGARHGALPLRGQTQIHVLLQSHRFDKTKVPRAVICLRAASGFRLGIVRTVFFL